MPSLIELKLPLLGNVTKLSKRQQSRTIAPLIGSSDYQAISDDALKDEDNAGWVLQLEPSMQQEWIEHIRWIRLADRLAEFELVCSGKSEFQTFLSGWQMLRCTGKVDDKSPYSRTLQDMQERWFEGTIQPVQASKIQAWNQYLSALNRYHAPGLVIQTCADYEQMLTHLAGAFFQILPHLPGHHRLAACYFGVVDQFYNHLRDLQEDCTHGICYLPMELLDGFGVSREEMVQQRATQNPNYHKMMQFWLNVYLPRLRCNVWHLRTASDLPLPWQILSDWSIQRYQRIEQVFRDCQFDYTRFPDVYWQRVRLELPMLRNQVEMAQARVRSQDVCDYAYRRGWKTQIISASGGARLQALTAI